MTDPARAPAVAVEASSSGARGYRAALALLAAGSVLALVSAGRTWVTAVAGGGGLPSVTVALSGSELEPAVTAIALLGLAAVAGLLATRRRGRVVIGVLVTVAGLAVVALAVDVATTWSSPTGVGATIRSLVADHVGTESPAGTSLSPWWLGAAVGGLLMVAAGLLATVRSRDWPQMGRRYERADASAPRPAESAWDQLDHGLDPTLDPAPGAEAAGSAGARTEGEGSSDASSGHADPMLGSEPPA